MALRSHHPGVALCVEVNNWQKLLERLQAEDIEFFVVDAIELPNDPALDAFGLVAGAGESLCDSGRK